MTAYDILLAPLRTMALRRARRLRLPGAVWGRSAYSDAEAMSLVGDAIAMRCFRRCGGLSYRRFAVADRDGARRVYAGLSVALLSGRQPRDGAAGRCELCAFTDSPRSAF